MPTTKSLLESYREDVWPHLWATLQGVVGQPIQLVTDEALFRSQILERGWQSLPDSVKSIGRARLRWDELLLRLRREVFAMGGGKLALRADAQNSLQTTLNQLVGPPTSAVPTTRAAEAEPIWDVPENWTAGVPRESDSVTVELPPTITLVARNDVKIRSLQVSGGSRLVIVTTFSFSL